MKNSASDWIFDISNYIFLFIFGFITFYPLYYVLIYSLSDPTKAMSGVYFFPVDITLINYIQIFAKNEIMGAAFISASRTILGTALTVFGCSMFAFGLTKDILPLRKIIYKLTVITMYFSVGLIPWYLTMRLYGFKNNFLLYIIPGIISPFYMILIKTFFEQLPPSIEESAMIDGAGYFRIFRSIIFPTSLPIIATIAIFAAVGQWNAWTDNLYLNPSPKLRTLQYLLYNFMNQMSAFEIINSAKMRKATIKITPSSVRMTITIIVTLPIFIVYPLMQRYFIKGIMIGAVKE